MLDPQSSLLTASKDARFQKCARICTDGGGHWNGRAGPQRYAVSKTEPNAYVEMANLTYMLHSLSYNVRFHPLTRLIILVELPDLLSVGRHCGRHGEKSRPDSVIYIGASTLLSEVFRGWFSPHTPVGSAHSATFTMSRARMHTPACSSPATRASNSRAPGHEVSRARPEQSCHQGSPHG